MCSYSVIVLAAGNGSRLKSSTLKVLHKVGGLALLDHVIRSAKSINPKEVVVITKPDFSMDQLKFADGVITAFQDVQKGTAHAVQCGLSVLSKKNDSKNNEWVYILYADIPLVTPATLMEMQKEITTIKENSLDLMKKSQIIIDNYSTEKIYEGKVNELESFKNKFD